MLITLCKVDGLKPQKRQKNVEKGAKTVRLLITFIKTYIIFMNTHPNVDNFLCIKV